MEDTMSCGFGTYFLGGMLGRVVGPIAQDFFYLKTSWGRKLAAEKAAKKDEEAEKELERQMQRDRAAHDRQLALMREQFERNKENAERQIFNAYAEWQQKMFWDECFPLRNPYDMPMGYDFTYEENTTRLKQCKLTTVMLANNKQIVPLRVITALIGSSNSVSTINSNLSMFLTDNYSANYEHAVVSDIGSWKSKIPVNDASMQYLFKGLKGQPVMVLEPNYTDGGNTLRLKIWSWSLGEQLQYPVGFDFGLFDLKQLKGNIVIAEVKKHKALLEKVQTPIDPKKTFGIVCEEIDKIENNLISGNLNEDEANRLYKKIAPPSEVQDDVNKRADAIISTVYACAVGMYADAYHLYQYGTLPLLPKLLHNMDGAEYVVPQLRDYYITLISIAQNKGILNLNDSINLELDMLDVFKRLNAPKEDCDPLKQNVRSLVFYADGAEKQKYINRLKLM